MRRRYNRLENEIRHAAVCEEINRVYKHGPGEEFHEAFRSFHDRNGAMEMSRNLLGLNLDISRLSPTARSSGFRTSRSETRSSTWLTIVS